MFSKCPGQDMRNLRVEVYKCPSCGSDVEIFSDETRIKCQKCGSMVFKERLPSCIEWCSSARQCLGEERWKQLMNYDENKSKEMAGDNEGTQKNS